MGFVAVIGAALLAGGLAFGLAVSANPLGFPDLTRRTLERHAAAVLERQPAPSSPRRTVAAHRETMQSPAIHVLRAEPDGSFVVAGHAKPESTVDLVDHNGTIVASGPVDRTGDFVLVPEKRLKPGSHELRLRTRSDNGETVSHEAAVISIPNAKTRPVLAAVLPENTPENASASTSPPPPPPPPLVNKEGPTPDVAIEAVEVASGHLAVAGAAKRGATVQVYLDNKPIGRATGTADGRFLLETETKLAAGRHNMRADLIDGSNGSVIARAAVPVLHKTAAQLAQADAVETGSSVIIRRGDSLWRISRRTYGRGIRYTTIFAANRAQIRDPDRIYVGQIFKLPVDESARRTKAAVN